MRVLLAGNHPQVQWALRTAIKAQANLSLVGEIVKADQILSQTEILQPDLIFMEWEMSGDPAGSALQSLRRLANPPRLIVLNHNLQLKDAAMAAGADFFISMADPPEKLLEILQTLIDTDFKRRDPK